jgi:hypothetical protein
MLQRALKKCTHPRLPQLVLSPRIQLEIRFREFAGAFRHRPLETVCCHHQSFVRLLR